MFGTGHQCARPVCPRKRRALRACRKLVRALRLRSRSSAARSRPRCICAKLAEARAQAADLEKYLLTAGEGKTVKDQPVTFVLKASSAGLVILKVGGSRMIGHVDQGEARPASRDLYHRGTLLGDPKLRKSLRSWKDQIQEFPARRPRSPRWVACCRSVDGIARVHGLTRCRRARWSSSPAGIMGMALNLESATFVRR